MEYNRIYRENRNAYKRLQNMQGGGSKMFKFEIDEYATAWQMFWRQYKLLPENLREKYRDLPNGMRLLMMSRHNLIFGKEYYEARMIKDMIDEIMETKEYEEFLKKIIQYKEDLEDEWNKKEGLILNELRNIMKVDLPPLETHIITVVPNAGFNLRNNHIYWGAMNNHEFPNYGIIYLIHEYLHTVFGLNDVDHTVIELIADNELRKRLNLKDDYALENKESVGHDFLDDLRSKMMDEWNEYLTTNKYSDIFEFASHMKEKYDRN